MAGAMAGSYLSCISKCVLMQVAILVLLVVDGVFSARLEPSNPPPSPPWTAPYNSLAHAPIHTHNYEPPKQSGGDSDSTHLPLPPPLTTQILPLPNRPNPYFTTLPFPLPRPLLCPPLGFYPYAPFVYPYPRQPPKGTGSADAAAASLYQNNGSPIFRYPLFPFPYPFRCYPFPLPQPRIFPQPFPPRPFPRLPLPQIRPFPSAQTPAATPSPVPL